jgi:hypothetical protein
MLDTKIFICVNISTISIIGNQYITSFSFNLPAENPRMIQVNRYLKPIILKTTIHWYWKAKRIIGKRKNNICEIKNTES